MVELSKQLELDLEPQIQRLTGGNPGALVDVKVAGLKEWIKSDVISRLVDALEDASTSIPEDKLWVEVEKAADSIDVARVYLKMAMLKHNAAAHAAWVRLYRSSPGRTGSGSAMITRCQHSTALSRLRWLGGAPMWPLMMS
jgi:hypothetical protein